MPRASKAQKEKKRRAVAKGVLAGKGTKLIARKAGCSTRNVQRLAAEPETQFLITEAMRPHREKLRDMAGNAIAAVESALIADKGDTQDHFTRLRAVERYNDLLELAQGKQAEEGDHSAGILTWEEFLLVYRRGNADSTTNAPSLG